MKNTKRTLSLIFAATTAVSTFVSTGCSGGNKRNEQVIKDPLVCNIQVYKAGYGTDWLYELETKFEAAYKDENYQINILTPSYDMNGTTALQLMAQGYEETGVDLYIIGNVQPNQVGVDGSYGVVVSDIRGSVFNQKAIGYDGKEEEKTVSEKINADIIPYTEDDNGVMYGFNWVNAASGFVVNTKKLARYGITELPKTTNEMFDIFEKIYLGSNGVANSIESKTMPMVYNGYYAKMAYYTWLAQYDFDEYTRILTMQTTDSEGSIVPMTDNGYEIMQSSALEEVTTLIYRTFDYNIASYGGTQLTLDQAQAAIMKDTGSNGVFMVNGDWFLNEVKLNYKNYLDDIDYIPIPVISALGTRLFGEGTSYNFDETQCDELLSYIVNLVDEDKTVEEIVNAVKNEKGITITEEIANSIYNARGRYYSRGIEHLAYIDKNAGAKNVAELFLRMMASDDFAETFAKYSNATSPYTKTINEYSEYKFVRNASKIFARTSQSIISQIQDTSGYRAEIGLSNLFTTTTDLAVTVAGMDKIVSMYSNGTKTGNTAECYRTQAQAFLQNEYDNLKKNWTYWTK